MESGLTTKQKEIIKELDEIYTVIGMDYWNIQEYPKEMRTSILAFEKRQAIVSAIITRYTLIDGQLNVRIWRYFFGSSKNPIELWKDEKFLNFNYYILERLYLLQKVRLVGSFYEIPNNIRRNVKRLDALRNAVAHAFFPEKRKDYEKSGKVVYKGKNIFTLEGIKLFSEDMGSVSDFFFLGLEDSYDSKGSGFGELNGKEEIKKEVKR